MLEVSIIAGLSAFFYASLALIAAGYYLKFRRIQLESPSKDTYYHSKFGRYDTPKVSFFLVLMISASMDVPLYIGCLVQGGPHDCEWDDLSYAVSWFLHLIAVCGYAYTIMIPCILWNDIIMNKDGKLFNSQFKADHTKRFFQIASMLYVINTAVNAINAMISYRVHDHNHYTEKDNIADVLTFFEPLLIFGITVGCFWCGLRLQSYVMRAKLGWKTELKFLLHLNIPMLVIMCTYLARAIFVLRLVLFMPGWYRHSLTCSYLVWIIVTRWLPYIFCSIVLVLMMRFSGAEVAAKHSKTNSQIAGINSPPPGRRRQKSIKESLLENDHLLGSGTNGRGSEDLFPLGGGHDITQTRKQRQPSTNTNNNTVSSLSTYSSSGFGTSTHQTVSSKGGGGTRNILHTNSQSTSQRIENRDIESGNGATDVNSNKRTLSGIPVIPASSSLDRSLSQSNSRKLSKLTLPNLYDDEARSNSATSASESNSLDVISGGDSNRRTLLPPKHPSSSTGATATSEGGIGSVNIGQNGRSIYLNSYEEEPSFLSDQGTDPLGLSGTSRILSLEDPHLLGGNDDEYYSTSGYGYEENQSSLESMATREFSVEYFLHQTMFINMARSFNSSNGGQSPPKFSVDETQPFIK